MRVVIGLYAYLTKINLLGLKNDLDVPFEYIRGIYDYIVIIKDKKTSVKVMQDGLILLETECGLEDISWHYVWLQKHVLSKIRILDAEDIFYKSIFWEKPPTIIIVADQGIDIAETFKKVGRRMDYSLSTKYFQKQYGDGLAIYTNVKLKDLSEVFENQVVLADYQNLTKVLLKENERIWKEVSAIRNEKKYNFHDLPEVIDELLEKRRVVESLLHRVHQLDDAILTRAKKCTIKEVLKELRMDDYDEMVRVNNYLLDQFEMTKDYLSSSLELIEFVYRENEQKALNILQVIFAIGTIAALIGLSQISNDRFVLPGTGAAGDLITYDFSGMLAWSGFSIVLGVIIFLVFNYIFFHAKKLRIMNFGKKRVLVQKRKQKAQVISS